MPDDPAPDIPDIAAPTHGDAPTTDPGAADADDKPGHRNGPPSVLARNLVIGPLILLVIAGYVGDTFFLAYHDEHPLIFIALNARSRNVVLASPYLDPVSYYVVGTLRLLVSDPLFFLLGIWYGDGAVRWMENKSPTYGGMFRSVEGWFAKAAYPLIAFAPNNFICLFAGAAGISVPVFLVLNIGGTLVRLYVLRWVGDIFSSPLHSVSSFITSHRIPVLVVSLLLVAFTVWSERRRGGTELADLAHIDEEISRTSAPDPAGGTNGGGDGEGGAAGGAG